MTANSAGPQLLIDVWDVETFDADLIAELRANAGLVRNYITTEQEIFLDHDVLGPNGRYRSNPHAESYYGLLERMGRKMQSRIIRAWHYTRLTDPEVETLLAAGIRLSTLETTRQRLDAQVAAGQFSDEISNALFEASPFHNSEQFRARTSKFWMTSHPVEIGDDGVTLLLANWGGEAVYFWLKDPRLKEVVARIGKPRVVEVAVPLDATPHAHESGKAVVDAFANAMGWKPDSGVIDLSVTHALGPEAIIAVHSEDEPVFARIGNGYPTNFHP